MVERQGEENLFRTPSSLTNANMQQITHQIVSSG